MQISSAPLETASSAMSCMTGFTMPSRSAMGSMDFCTVVAAGYMRAPLPAAVITAFLIFMVSLPGDALMPAR